MKITMNCNCPQKHNASPSFGRFVFYQGIPELIARGNYFKGDCPNMGLTPSFYEKKMKTLMDIIEKEKSNPVVTTIQSNPGGYTLSAVSSISRGDSSDIRRFTFDSAKEDICDFLRNVSEEIRYKVRYGDDSNRSTSFGFLKLKDIYTQKLKDVINSPSTKNEPDSFQEKCYKKLYQILNDNPDFFK